MRAREADRLVAEETAAARREAARRATELEVARTAGDAAIAAAEAASRAEAEGRAREARDNEDVHARAAAAAAAADRERWVAALTAGLDRLGAGAVALATTHLPAVVAALVAVAAGVHASREGFALARAHAARLLSTPPLVRETSIATPGLGAAALAVADALTLGAASGLVGAVASVWRAAAALLGDAVDWLWAAAVFGVAGVGWALTGGLLPPPTAAAKGCGKRAARRGTTSTSGADVDPLAGVVLPLSSEAVVRTLAASTAAAHAHGAPLRHALFHGPPGTGKSLVAGRLARCCGLDYAVLAGGDVAPLGPAAVTELHRLFDWVDAAVSSGRSRGLVLFIDEAEAFLGARNRGAPAGGGDDGVRHALSALLARTGGAGCGDSSSSGAAAATSDRVMLVLATNRPGDLDAAVLDRCDERVAFACPDAGCRVRLGRLYFHRLLVGRSQLAAGGLPGFTPTEAAPLPTEAAVKADAARRAGDGSLSKPPHPSLAARLWRGSCGAVAGLLRGLAATPSTGCTAAGATRIAIAPDVTAEALDALLASPAADGMSGRQVAKAVTAVQAAVFAQGAVGAGCAGRRRQSTEGAPPPPPTLTLALLREAIGRQRAQLRAPLSAHDGCAAAGPVTATLSASSRSPSCEPCAPSASPAAASVAPSHSQPHATTTAAGRRAQHSSNRGGGARAALAVPDGDDDGGGGCTP